MELVGHFGLLVYGGSARFVQGLPFCPLNVELETFVGPSFTYFENLVPVGGIR